MPSRERQAESTELRSEVGLCAGRAACLWGCTSVGILADGDIRRREYSPMGLLAEEAEPGGAVL